MPGRGQGSRALADLFLGTSIVETRTCGKTHPFVFVLHYTAVLDRAIHYLLSQEAFQLQEDLLNLTRLHNRSKVTNKTIQYLLYSYDSALMADHDQEFYLWNDFVASATCFTLIIHLTNKKSQC